MTLLRTARPPEAAPPGTRPAAPLAAPGAVPVAAPPDGPGPGASIDLAGLLDRLGAALHGMGRDGRDLQDALSPALAAAAATDPHLLVAIQRLDALTQHVEALATLAEALAPAAPPHWRVPLAPVEAIPLADLRAALGGGAADEDWLPFDDWPGDGWAEA